MCSAAGGGYLASPGCRGEADALLLPVADGVPCRPLPTLAHSGLALCVAAGTTVAAFLSAACLLAPESSVALFVTGLGPLLPVATTGPIAPLAAYAGGLRSDGGRGKGRDQSPERGSGQGRGTGKGKGKGKGK
eukprot:EG_transcript_46451